MSSPVLPVAPLSMAPHFSPRPWGGALLRDRLGKATPEGVRVGESWEVSDHPNGRSRIADGPLAGMEFGEALRRHPLDMIGRESAPERHPLLVKIIDAAEDLSIQVHPDDAHAARTGDRGKTECWYVMDCEPGTEIIFGVADGITMDDLARGARDGSIEGMMARRPIRPGSFLFVRAGTVHAILGGTLICEIQQSSDTTYRLWDWGRKPERELHLEQSWEVIDLGSRHEPTQPPAPGLLTEPMVLTDNEYFRVRAMDVQPGATDSLPEGLEPTGQIIVCVAGAGSIAGRDGDCALGAGGAVFLPAVCRGRANVHATGDGPMRILIAESREL